MIDNKEEVQGAIKEDMEWAMRMSKGLEVLYMKGQFDVVDQIIKDLNLGELNATQICCACRYMSGAKNHLKMFDHLLERSISRLKELGENPEEVLIGLI